VDNPENIPVAGISSFLVFGYHRTVDLSIDFPFTNACSAGYADWLFPGNGYYGGNVAELQEGKNNGLTETELNFFPEMGANNWVNGFMIQQAVFGFRYAESVLKNSL
jgi:hypothetical protein